MTAPGAEIRVEPVAGRRDFNRFYHLPGIFQGRDPAWVEPLAQEARHLWSERNPWFRHARAQAWIAWREGRPVGRISAQVDSLQDQAGRADLGLFGQLEAVDEPAVFRALLDTAANWLKARGKRRMQGPFDLSINQRCGLLVEGFKRPPMIMMGHAPPYYARHLEAMGLVPAAELLAYYGDPRFPRPPAMNRVLGRMGRRLVFEPLTAHTIRHQAGIIREIFNDAWSGNWGFVPFTAAEFEAMVAEMRPLVRRNFLHLARVDGEPAGFIVALPDLNEMIADLHGRLLPTGWIRLLWRLQRGRFRQARVPLLGVRRKHQRGLLGAAVTYGLIEAARDGLVAAGVRAVEMSWILEGNRPMRDLIESLGFCADKRYRIYEQEIA